MKTLLKRMAVVLAAGLLTACGGGGGSAGTCLYAACNSSGGSAVAANLVVKLDKTTVGNSGSEEVLVSVVATDSTNNVVAGVPVTIEADAGTQVVASSKATDSTGEISASVVVGDANRSDRTVTVTVRAGELSRQTNFQVVGSKIDSTVVGSVLSPGDSGRIIYVVRDVNSNPMVKQSIRVVGVNGVVVDALTDTNGAYAYTYSVPANATAGEKAIVATAAGVSKSDIVTVVTVSGGTVIPDVPAGAIKAASAEANPSVVSVNTPVTNNQAAIRALFVGDSNAPIKNVRVRFDLNGDANSIGGTFSTGSNLVYSTATGEATSAYIPADRSSPTDGLTVRACYGYTDSALAGGACPNFVLTTLTVVSQPVSVSIGTNNVLIDKTETYAQDFVVTVVDASGAAKPGVVITPSVDLLRFAKGYWSRGAGDSAWTQFITQYFERSDGTPWYLEDPRSAEEKALDPDNVRRPLINERAACWNEDRNRNGVLEAAEDARAGTYSITAGGNGNGRLDPAKADIAISIAPSSANTTDASGKVIVRIEYAKNLASWLEYKILVAAGGVSGTEGRATWVGVLRAPRADITAEVEPAFAVNRYGKLAGCDNPQ